MHHGIVGIDVDVDDPVDDDEEDDVGLYLFTLSSYLLFKSEYILCSMVIDLFAMLLSVLLLLFDELVLLVLFDLFLLYLLLVVLTATTEISILHVACLGAEGPVILRSARWRDVSLVNGSTWTWLPIVVKCLARHLFIISCLATL